jgi:hypothetical protein
MPAAFVLNTGASGKQELNRIYWIYWQQQSHFICSYATLRIQHSFRSGVRPTDRLERRAEFEARVTQNFSICHDLHAVLNRPGRVANITQYKNET